MILSHGCIYELAGGDRCGRGTIPGRHLCADHVTAVCGCGRQAVAECRKRVGRRVCGRSTCTKCRCPVHSGLREPKVILV